MANERFVSVWDALADTPEESANLKARAELMQQVVAIIDKADWNQSEAAERCKITQPRVSDLLRGHISKFSLDALVNIAAALNMRVHIELEVA